MCVVCVEERPGPCRVPMAVASAFPDRGLPFVGRYSQKIDSAETSFIGSSAVRSFARHDQHYYGSQNEALCSQVRCFTLIADLLPSMTFLWKELFPMHSL